MGKNLNSKLIADSNEFYCIGLSKTKKAKMVLALAMLIGFTFLFTGCSLYKVVSINGNNADKSTKFYFEDESFDANKYADSVWDSKVIPLMEKKAADISAVLKELKSDVNASGKKYGIRSAEDGSAWNFIVKGKGKVISVNTESRNGTLDVDLEQYDNKKDIIIQIGPVIKGTSIRDSLDFIKFDDFKNQLVFATISNAFNKLVNEKVIGKIDYKSLNSKEIEFVGAFTVIPSGEIVVTPVKLELAGGGK